MTYKISVPIEQTVKLLDIDPDGDTYVVVHQPTQRERLLREQFMERATTRSYSQDDRQIGVQSKITFEERRAYEIFLTMVECNVKDTDGETDLFPTRELNGKKSLALTWEQFQKAIGKVVDDAVVTALHHAALEVEPTWDYRPNSEGREGS
jgi:hypothetical protein